MNGIKGNHYWNPVCFFIACFFNTYYFLLIYELADYGHLNVLLMTLFVPRKDKKFTTDWQVIYQNYLSWKKTIPVEKASRAILDTEKVGIIGCPAGSPKATIGSAPRGMPARAATSYPPEAQCQGCLWNGR